MNATNAAAFCRDVKHDELLRAQVSRVPNDERRIDALVDLGRRTGYSFTKDELVAALGHDAVASSPLSQISVTHDLGREQLAAVSGAGWSMDEHWHNSFQRPGSAVKKIVEE
jgi:hypothetical protein